MSNSHVVQTLPALLIEFPHYCIIAPKLAPGYVMCCVNMRFIIPAKPPPPPPRPHPSPRVNLSQQFGHNWLNKLIVLAADSADAARFVYGPRSVISQRSEAE